MPTAKHTTNRPAYTTQARARTLRLLQSITQRAERSDCKPTPGFAQIQQAEYGATSGCA